MTKFTKFPMSSKALLWLLALFCPFLILLGVTVLKVYSDKQSEDEQRIEASIETHALPLQEPPEWMGIQVGQTTKGEVVNILGTGYEVKRLENADTGEAVLSYRFGIVHLDQKWRTVTVLTRHRGHEEIVDKLIFQSFREQPNREQSETTDGPTYWTTLGEYARNMGPPTLVCWGIAPTGRVLIWSERGTLIFTSTKMINGPDGAKGAWPTMLVLFEPQTSVELKSSVQNWSWSLPGERISLTNRFPAGTDREWEDLLPLDPYNWEELMQP